MFNELNSSEGCIRFQGSLLKGLYPREGTRWAIEVGVRHQQGGIAENMPSDKSRSNGEGAAVEPADSRRVEHRTTNIEGMHSGYKKRGPVSGPTAH